MGRKQNPLISKAEKMYREHGMKTPAIAKRLDVPEGTVRRWKAEGNWDSERSETPPPQTPPAQKACSKKPGPKKKVGGQPGNQNAVGNFGGAPPGNTNHLKHGFYWDSYTPEEQAMLERREDIGEEQRLLNQMEMWEMKIRRLKLELNKYQTVASGLALDSVTKKKDETSTTAVSTFQYIVRLETLLDSALRGYDKCISSLNEIRVNRKLNGLHEDPEQKEDVVFYIPENGRDKND